MTDRLLRQGEQVYETVRRMIRDLVARKSSGVVGDAGIESLDLSLDVALRGARADPEFFAVQLVAELEAQVDDALEQALAFRPGRTFCHHCGGSVCEHSECPSAQHVFVGFKPTGMPEWLPFSQYCLEIRHPDVQALYGDPPAFISVVHDAETLRENLLPAWDRSAYEILGQVTSGYFRLTRGRPEKEVLALTLQVVASAVAGGKRRLGLNVIGRAPDGADLSLLWERQGGVPWQRSVQWAQTALQTIIHDPRRATADDVETRVGGILTGLARRLERERRGRSRRTGHAEKRHRSGERPTRKAVDDVRTASGESFLLDERSGTLVVLGERGRTHFFAPGGKLVSSVRYSREAIERKKKLGQWLEAPGDQVSALRRSVSDDGQAAAPAHSSGEATSRPSSSDPERPS